MSTELTDAELLGKLAPAADPRWAEFFGNPLWSDPSVAKQDDLLPLTGSLYDLGVVVPFDWPVWHASGRYSGGHGLTWAPVADAVRLLTSYVRGDRFCDGALLAGVVDGTVPAAVRRLWDWYRSARVGDADFVDRSEYSSDETYRWSYERRWAPGGVLCWVGLNPGTGDTDAGRRPTLGRVVSWARRERCGAVVVVNLFSYRSTDPDALLSPRMDIVGELTDETIRRSSGTAFVTLAAWGGHKAIGRRSADVVRLLDNPMCVGLTKGGEPRHPLYIPAATALQPLHSLRRH
jgi:hypothetical protein